MKKMLAGITGAALMAITPGNAADLGRPVYKAPPPVPAPVRVFSWTGCYIGGNIGWGWGRDTVSAPGLALAEVTEEPELASDSPPAKTENSSGVLGGGQVGCNYQFAPNWVIGIEGDGEAANIKGDAIHGDTFTNPLTGAREPVSGRVHAQTDWIASATGRLGWTWDRVMLYAKGGAAWERFKYSADLPNFAEQIGTSVTPLGWTIGGGVEWAFWDNWSAKVEYDFYDFRMPNLSLPGTIAGTPEVVPGFNIKETIQTVKVGINYRFGTY
jgi:outer membrane immunogenic protein